jgi:hypothetical protein
MKVVADANEGLDCVSRDAVEIGWCIAEALGQRASHLEMELDVRVLGDPAIHRFHFGFEVLQVENGRHVMLPVKPLWKR